MPAGSHHVSFSPDGKLLAAIGERCVQAWSVGDGSMVMSQEVQEGGYPAGFGPAGI